MLRAHKHLTKKEIKKDPFLIFIAQATEYIQREWIKIAGVALGVILVVSISLLYVRDSRRSEMNAYDRAINALYSNAPESIDLLTQFIERYRRSDRSTKILLQLGNYYISEKNYQAAEQHYRMCIDRGTDDQIFGYNVYSGLGAVYEVQGDFERAGETYEGFLEMFRRSAFNDVMNFNAGKAYFLSGNHDAARRNFTAVLDATEDSDMKQEARYYLELLS
ncbi:hypothetical protein ACFL5H_03005 [Candidatus Latescibacterota bacterium]